MNKLVEFFNSLPGPIQFMIFMNVLAANVLLWAWLMVSVMRSSS